MGLENTTYIAGLNALWPLGTDGKNEGDDHLRLIKNVMQKTFHNGAELSYFVRPATTEPAVPAQWVWNDKADQSGTDVATMSEDGVLTAKQIATSDSGGQSFYADGLDNYWVNTTAHFWRFSRIDGEFTYFFNNIAKLQFTSGAVRLHSGAAFNSNGKYAAIESTGAYYLSYEVGYFQQWEIANGNWNFYAGNVLRLQVNGADGSLQVTNDTPFKPNGGPWVGNSDQRIKTVLGDYEAGLIDILALNPRRFTFKGNDTNEAPSNTVPDPNASEHVEPQIIEPATVPYPNSPHYPVAIAGTEFVGLIVQEMEAAGVFPEMIKKRAGYIDGAEVTDLRDLDTGPLVYALINAVKELSARLEEVEALVVP